MAKLYGQILGKDLLTLDKSFSRALGQPLDSSEVYYSLQAAKDYAKTAAAYVGQKIVVIENDKVTHYSVEDTAGTLKEVGSIPLGDGKSIEVVDGKITIHGFDSATDGYIPQRKDGEIKWVSIASVTDGDTNTITSGDGKSIITSGDDEALSATINGYEGAEVGATPVKTADGLNWVNIVEIAEGKTKTFVASTLTEGNAALKSQEDRIEVEQFYLQDGKTVITKDDVKVGDVVLLASVDYPDRWVSYITPLGTIYLSILETRKIDLTDYATKNDLTGYLDKYGNTPVQGGLEVQGVLTANGVEALYDITIGGNSYDKHGINYTWKTGEGEEEQTHNEQIFGISATAEDTLLDINSDHTNVNGSVWLDKGASIADDQKLTFSCGLTEVALGVNTEDQRLYVGEDKVVVGSDLDDYLSLSGGTLTGNLALSQGVKIQAEDANGFRDIINYDYTGILNLNAPSGIIIDAEGSIGVQLKHDNKTVFTADPEGINLGDAELPINITSSEVKFAGHVVTGSDDGMFIDDNLIITANQLAEATVGKAKAIERTMSGGGHDTSYVLPVVDNNGVFVEGTSSASGLGNGIIITLNGGSGIPVLTANISGNAATATKAEKAIGIVSTTNPVFESLEVPFVNQDGIFTNLEASGYTGLGGGLSVSVEKTEQDWNSNSGGYTTVLDTYARRAINDEEGNKIHTTYTKNTDEISTDRLVLGDQELILFGGDAGVKPEEGEE